MIELSCDSINGLFDGKNSSVAIEGDEHIK